MSASAQTINGLTYTYPAGVLKTGQSLGNSNCYATLDGKTDLTNDRSSVRYGLRESTNQRYYLLGWEASVARADRQPLLPVSTIFRPAYQETELKLDDMTVEKKFFLPFENGYLRSAHFLFNARTRDSGGLIVQTRLLLPEDAKVEQQNFKGQKYLRAIYQDGGVSVLWGSQGLRSFEVRRSDGKVTEAVGEFAWNPRTQNEFGLSLAYSTAGTPGTEDLLLNALFDMWSSGAPSSTAHLFRLHQLLEDSETTINRYLATTQLWTPDPVINRGYGWAKVNQIRMQQEYKRGWGFSNNPPSDVVVGRDSYWYLVGATYYAQRWSRKLLDLWYQYGLELSGKFTEYMMASREPIFIDDYGLNINDNTPLLMLAAYQYYCLTGDQEFLRARYLSLLNSADYIQSQRRVGRNNHYGLVWCTSTENFVRGLCSWRNVIQNYNLSGAVTEVNSECYQALLRTSELAAAMGDEVNRARLEAAARDLHAAIQEHLRASTGLNHFYCLNINPEGWPVDDMTSDLVFPVLDQVADQSIGQAIVRELFGPQFWASSSRGAGGIRTVSSAERAYDPHSTRDDYGLMGGVWPNVALWAGKAAAAIGLPDLAVQGLKGTFLLSERQEPAHYNVVAGEFPEYFNGDDLVQRGMPLSPFVPGIFIWSALEGFAGIEPHANRLAVNPELPASWEWVAVSNLPYRGNPVTMLAERKERILYTTAPVETGWHQVVTPALLQQGFSWVSDKPAFWLVVPLRGTYELLVASADAASGRLIEQRTGRIVVEASIPAGALVRRTLGNIGASAPLKNGSWPRRSSLGTGERRRSQKVGSPG